MAQIRTESELRTHFNITEKKHVLKKCNDGDVEYTQEYVNWLENLIIGKVNIDGTRTGVILPIQ